MQQFDCFVLSYSSLDNTPNVNESIVHSDCSIVFGGDFWMSDFENTEWQPLSSGITLNGPSYGPLF